MYYYEYQFISPEQIYAQVREEFKSYFDSGAIDDTMFPVYTCTCLERLGRGSLPLQQTILTICDFKAQLPPEFKYVREAWACEEWDRGSWFLPSATYVELSNTIRIDKPNVSCELCDNCEFPDMIQAVYKTKNQVIFKGRRHHLLEPGNTNAKRHCGEQSPNINCHSGDTFDIRDNDFVVQFREGIVHLVYYYEDYDENSYRLIPDNFYIKEFIKAYLRYMYQLQIYNQVTDETSRQVKEKVDYYEAKYNDTLIRADIESKKKTLYRKKQDIYRDSSRHNKYNIPY